VTVYLLPLVRKKAKVMNPTCLESMRKWTESKREAQVLDPPNIKAGDKIDLHTLAKKNNKNTHEKQTPN